MDSSWIAQSIQEIRIVRNRGVSGAKSVESGNRGKLEYHPRDPFPVNHACLYQHQRKLEYHPRDPFPVNHACLYQHQRKLEYHPRDPFPVNHACLYQHQRKLEYHPSAMPQRHPLAG
jgi:hypothetical protein